MKLKIFHKTKTSMPFQTKNGKEISRIGSTFGKTNRVIIDTDDHKYIIYTQNDQKVYNELTK